MTMLQIRHVPDDVHRRLKARAALAGRSLSDYALEQLVRSLERPSREEFAALIAGLPRREFTESAAEIIRRERDSQ